MSKHDPLRPNPYATGGHTQPLAAATAGRKFRVRNGDAPYKLWAKDVSWDQAHKLKERLAGQRKSTNLVIEDVSVVYPPMIMVAAPQPAPPPPRIQHPGGVTAQPGQPAKPANGQGEPDAADVDPILTEDGELNIDDLGDLGAS